MCVERPSVWMWLIAARWKPKSKKCQSEEHLKISCFKLLLWTGKKCQLQNDDSWTALACIYEFLFLCQWPDGLWVKGKTSWKLGLLIFGAPIEASFVPPDLGVVFNEAKQLQFSFQSGNEGLCVPCHPVLIWALMYFINKGLLSSLTVVTPWFQCRMHAVRGYNINNQLAAITPF